MPIDHDSETPLCVDLDGTLIAGDISVESLLHGIKYFPIKSLQALLTFSLSKIKSELAQVVILDPSCAKVNEEFFSFLKEEKNKGRKTYLVSASTQKQVQAYGDYFNVFDESIGSSSTLNLKGENKAKYLVQRFGQKGFDYAGNGDVDLPVWRDAKNAIIVGALPTTIQKASLQGNVVHIFDSLHPNFTTWMKVLRVHQWAKNLLLFLPLFLSHQLSFASYFDTVKAFISFCLIASGIYILNDLFDLDADRQHTLKKKRPIPAGLVTLQSASLLSASLILTGITLASILPQRAFFLIALYTLITFMYSIFLKRIVLIDIFILASLYVLRILTGGAAAQVFISPWMLAFSLFFFLSLSALKRFSELHNLSLKGKETTKGRGYEVKDQDQISIFGASSGYLSVVIFTLYITSPEVRILYSTPECLWFIIPVLLYWMSRVWLFAHRGKMHEDPVLFALRDGVSYVVFSIAFIIVLLSV